MPAKVDPPAQKKFLEEQLQPLLKQAQCKLHQVWFVDASHFVFALYLGYLWCLVRCFVRAPCGRKRYNVLGALNAVTHEMVQVTNHAYINSHSVCELLVKLAAQRNGMPVTVVLDNAPYQRCKLVQQKAKELGIRLLFLPSYSPNLNLIERVWKFVKKECLNSRYLTEYSDFTQAIDKCLDELQTTHRDQMKTLLTHDFQMFEDVPVLTA